MHPATPHLCLHRRVTSRGGQYPDSRVWVRHFQGRLTFLSPSHPVSEVSERLPGDQCNFSAESMAILHGLLTHHPETPLTFFVDNHAAILRTDQDDCNLPRTRSNRPARAIWNRVAACLRDRPGLTAFRWVHSHPKASPRATKVNDCGLVCACGQTYMYMYGPNSNQRDHPAFTT